MTTSQKGNKKVHQIYRGNNKQEKRSAHTETGQLPLYLHPEPVNLRRNYLKSLQSRIVINFLLVTPHVTLTTKTFPCLVLAKQKAKGYKRAQRTENKGQKGELKGGHKRVNKKKKTRGQVWNT